MKERLKLEGKIELELAGLEFNHDTFTKQRDEQQKQYEIELKVLKDREECLRQRENEVRKKESRIEVRRSSNSIAQVKGIFQDIDQWSQMADKENTPINK